MNTSRRINSIDIGRLVAAVFVIAIHTQAITWFSGRSNGDIQILTRIAVPFFFCVSGYFLRKEKENSGCAVIILSIKRTVLLYLKVSIVYFAIIFLQNPSLLNNSLKWVIIDFTINGSYYHLWYLVAIIYLFALIYVFCKLRLERLLLPLSILLYVAGLLGTLYYAVGCNIPVLSTLFDSSWFLIIRRILLMGFPFVVLG